MQNPGFELDVGGYYECDTRWRSPRAKTAYMHKFYFPLEGGAWVEYGRRFELRPGRVYFLPGYSPMRYGCDGRMTLYWLHARPRSGLLDAHLARYAGPVDWPAEPWLAWRPVWSRLDRYFERRETTLELRIGAMLMCMVADLIDRRPLDAEPGLPGRLRPALEVMDARFRQPPTLDQLADRAHLSPVYFHSLVKRHLGVSPHRYMLRKRMDAARQLLTHSNLPVAEVAAEAGYDNPFYFSRVFKKFYQLSPTQLRREMQTPRP